MILDGKRVATNKLDKLREKIASLNKILRFTIILANNDPASLQYVKIKTKRAKELGLVVDIKQISGHSIASFKAIIDQNIKNGIGIMIQLPINESLNRQEVLDLVPRELDIDGLCSRNLDALGQGNEIFRPAVVNAVTSLIEFYKIETSNKKIIIIGDSPVVGRPIFHRLKHEYEVFAKSISLIGENTSNSQKLIEDADIIISCIGKPHHFSAKDLKEEAILIDVGTSRNDKGKIVGDFYIESESKIAAYTPVPGGIGPLTVACLLENVIRMYKY